MSDEWGTTEERCHVQRRTIVRGAAWSLPAVALMATAPGSSASEPCTESGTFAAARPPAGAGVSAAAANDTFVVPPGITSLTFSVQGSAGGTSGGGWWYSGDLVTGSIVVTPGQVLQLITGQGGAQGRSSNAGAGAPVQTGGRGTAMAATTASSCRPRTR